MNFDINEYIRGRLMIGGCALTVIIVAIIITAIIMLFKSFIEQWFVWLFILAVFAVIFGVCFVLAVVKTARQQKIVDEETDKKDE